MSHFHPLAIKHVRNDTRDAIVVTFDVPSDLREPFRFKQGQFLTLEADIEGEPVRRSYSICSGVTDEALRVAIKRVPGGAFSSWAHDRLKAGATVRVAPPDGRFHVPLARGSAHHYLAFAAGSGITPVLSIIASTLAHEPASHFTLVYGNRASSSVMFREELQQLKDRHLDRLALIFVMSREQQDVELLNGRIDRAKCEQLFQRWIDVTNVEAAFICGPEEMARGVAAALDAAGVDHQRVKVESFGVTGTPQRTLTGTAPALSDERTHVELIFDGRRRDFVMPRSGEPILDAALRHGIDVPYSCRSGVCGTCRATLTAGEVDLDINYALEDYEIARGAILMCQSYPVTADVAVNADASRPYLLEHE
jgi:ring-1,2-phenylacetyl-CoA epoxidase subunit PaaE